MFGYSVAISGTTAIVGADFHEPAGSAYVFTKTAGGWKQTAELGGFDAVAGDAFGLSVAISGTTAIVSAVGRASNAGRVDVFTKTAGAWKRCKYTAANSTESCPSRICPVPSRPDVIVSLPAAQEYPL
jgi:hypothetical protein